MPLLPLAIVLQDTFSLQSIPVENTVFPFQLKLKITQESVVTTVDSIYERRILKVQRDGSALVSVKNLRSTVTYGSDSATDERPAERQFWVDAYGKILRFEKITGDKGKAALISVITQFVAPPQPTGVGSGWSVPYPAADNALQRTVQSNFQFSSVNAQTATIGMTMREEGGKTSFTGTWRLSPKDGSLQTLTGTMLEFPGLAGSKAELELVPAPVD